MTFSPKGLAKAQKAMALHLEQGEVIEGFIFGMKWGTIKTSLVLGAAGMLFQRQPVVMLTDRNVYMVQTKRAGSWTVDQVVAKYPRGTVGAIIHGSTLTVGDYEVKLAIGASTAKPIRTLVEAIQADATGGRDVPPPEG